MKRIITIGLLLGGCSAFASTTYTITNLNQPVNGCALASNGNVACPDYNAGNVKLFNYSAGTTSTIPLSGGPLYTNASGQVVVGNNGTFFDGTTVFSLPAPNFSGFTVSGIDNAGDIVGITNSFGMTQGVVWTQTGSMINYNTFGIPNPSGFFNIYVSPNGTIAYPTAFGDYVSSVSNGYPQGIQSVDSLNNAQLDAVSDSGIVVGTYFGGAFEASAAGGVVQICPSCTGITTLNPSGVNSSGDAVGYASDAGSGHAFLYSGGQISDLNTLLASNLNAILGGTGWFLQYATGINDNGQILATATNSSTFAYQAVLLTPATSATPEPGTLGLVAIGGALAYFASRRRRGTAEGTK